MANRANKRSRTRVQCHNEWRAAAGGGDGDNNNISATSWMLFVAFLSVNAIFLRNQNEVSNIFISFNKRQFISVTIDCGAIFFRASILYHLFSINGNLPVALIESICIAREKTKTSDRMIAIQYSMRSQSILLRVLVQKMAPTFLLPLAFITFRCAVPSSINKLL